MRRSLTAALLLLAFGGALGGATLGGMSPAQAQGETPAGVPLPSTPKLPSFGRGLFAPRSSDKAAPQKGGADVPLPGRPTLLTTPASTFAGREATLQALQDCYAREAAKVRAGGLPETRIRRLRLACENEEIADTRAWLKWSKVGDSRQSRRIVNAIQQDDAEKALAAAAAQPAP